MGAHALLVLIAQHFAGLNVQSKHLRIHAGPPPWREGGGGRRACPLKLIPQSVSHDVTLSRVR